MKKRIFIMFWAMVILPVFSQTQEPNKQALQAPTNVIYETNNNIVLKDSIAQIKAKKKPDIVAIDNKLVNELYNISLYDEVRNSINNLNYESVDYPELSTELLKVRLTKLNEKTPFDIAYNPSLERVIKSFLKYRKESIQRLIDISAFYFPMFEEILDSYNLPLEIKYLAVVESALRPNAKSPVGATGLWQFMFNTGKMYGLDVSSYVDERSDPIKSTKAAAEYLSKLYEIFGDWDLALAAYNSGPGNVTKAIRRSGEYQNYWNIRSYLPRETAGYLPAFLAYMYIFEYAQEHGFKKPKTEFAYIETDTVQVKQMISLDQVSENTGIAIETLQFLNAPYKLDIIPYVPEEQYTIRLPRNAIGDFVSNENAIYASAKAEFDAREKPLPQFFEAEEKNTYKVKSGDVLGSIANKFNVKVSQLKQWNGLRSNNISVGQKLNIYNRKPTHIASTTPKTTGSNLKEYILYTVKEGDTLWDITQKFPGVTIENIKEWNDFSGTKLKPGMKLKISKG